MCVCVLESTNLKHLDERDTQVEVCQIAADEREGEEYANGDNGAEIDPSSHWYRVS